MLAPSATDTTALPSLARRSPQQRVPWSGILTWAVAGAPLAVAVARDPRLALEPRVATGLAAFVVFGVAFLRRFGRGAVAATVQVAAAIVAMACVPFPLPNAPLSALLAVVAAPRFALAGADRLGVAAIALQTLAMAWIYGDDMGWPVGAAVFLGSALGLMVFTFGVARIVAREANTSRELADAVAALAATQPVVAAGERLSERVRIARDLHDSIGHHLTTLSLHLELARRQPADAARRSLDVAHTVCRALLSELRDVLADVRATDGRELAAALRELAARVPMLAIELDVDDDLGALDPDRAHALLRCGQEAITNALRHAGASRLRLSLSRSGGLITLTATDDGRGLDRRRPGGGLDGIALRLQHLGGTLDVTAGRTGVGTTVRASLPMPSSEP